MDIVAAVGLADDERAAMDRIKCREKIRGNLQSGLLPRDFDVTRLIVGHPPDRTTCAGYGEVFAPDELDALAHSNSDQDYWFHRDCEKLWQQERIGQHRDPDL